MPSLEKFCHALFSTPRFLQRVLLWGALLMVPILNLLAFGYLYQYVRQTREGGGLVLPAWDEGDFVIRFLDGVRVLVVWLVHGALPMLIAGMVSWGLSWFFDLIALDLLANSLAWAPLALTTALSPILTATALYLYQRNEDARVLLRFETVWRMVSMGWLRLWLLVIAYPGALLVGFAVAPWVAFVGMLVILVFTTGVMAQMHQRAG